MLLLAALATVQTGNNQVERLLDQVAQEKPNSDEHDGAKIFKKV